MSSSIKNGNGEKVDIENQNKQIVESLITRYIPKLQEEEKKAVLNTLLNKNTNMLYDNNTIPKRIINKSNLQEAIKRNPKECKNIIRWLETDELSIRNLQQKIDSGKFDGPTVIALKTTIQLLHLVNVSDDIIKIPKTYIREAEAVARLRTGKNSLKKIEEKIKNGDDSIQTLIKLDKCIEELRKLGISEERIQRNHILPEIKRNNPYIKPKKDSV